MHKRQKSDIEKKLLRKKRKAINRATAMAAEITSKQNSIARLQSRVAAYNEIIAKANEAIAEHRRDKP